MGLGFGEPPRLLSSCASRRLCQQRPIFSQHTRAYKGETAAHYRALAKYRTENCCSVLCRHGNEVFGGTDGQHGGGAELVELAGP